MNSKSWIAAIVAGLMAGGTAWSGEPQCCPPPGEYAIGRIAPVGGWHPYGGGLLHWWPRHCFPQSSAPDDYCRKSLPRVCWPPYPPYYIWGPPLPADCAAPK